MHTKNPIPALLASLLLVGCGGTARTAGAPQAAAFTTADSIVLERTRCYGTCPAYRLRVAADGRVAFTSRYPDEGRTAAGTVEPRTFRRLLDEARVAGFFALPDTIARDRALCEAPATDLPTVTLAVYAAGAVREVVDDRGCSAPPGTDAAARLAALRALTARVDTLALAPGWIRRPSRR